jgi:hypothetical protein
MDGTSAASRLAGVALALFVVGLPGQRALAGRAAEDARAYCQANGLRPREVHLPDGTVRLVVPVTSSTALDFARRFSEANNYCRLRESYRELGTFCFLSLNPGRIYHHRDVENKSESHLFTEPCSTRASHYRRSSQLALANPGFYETAPAFAFPVSLTVPQLQHLKDWLRRAPTDPQVNATWSNCMHFTGNAEVEPGVRLFDWLRVPRSKDGPNMIAKLAHSANEHLEVVARYVKDQTAFDALKEAALLGPAPVSKAAR